jgi:tRNA 2-thiouridine synthesizing protein A
MADQDMLTVDSRGHRCPTPTLRLRRALEQAGVGDAVLVLADDPLAKIDIPHFAQVNGHQVVDLSVQNGVVRIIVRKGG